jgi:hypothetical protein
MASAAGKRSDIVFGKLIRCPSFRPGGVGGRETLRYCFGKSNRCRSFSHRATRPGNAPFLDWRWEAHGLIPGISMRAPSFPAGCITCSSRSVCRRLPCRCRQQRQSSLANSVETRVRFGRRGRQGPAHSDRSLCSRLSRKRRCPPRSEKSCLKYTTSRRVDPQACAG